MCSQHFCNHFPKKVTEHSFSAIIKVLPQSLLLLEEIKIKIKKELANEASACQWLRKVRLSGKGLVFILLSVHHPDTFQFSTSPGFICFSHLDPFCLLYLALAFNYYQCYIYYLFIYTTYLYTYILYYIHYVYFLYIMCTICFYYVHAHVHTHTET